MNWLATGPANGHTNCFAPGRYTLKHVSADVVAALLGVLRENFLRDIHDPANGRRLSGRSLKVSASGVESKHGNQFFS